MLSKIPGKKLDSYVPDYVVFDLETTGISCEKDEVVEISALKVKNGQVVDGFSTLVDPKIPIPAVASAVNGITDDMVAGRPSFGDALRCFLVFVGDAVLVGHNIEGFDLKFLNRGTAGYWNMKIGNDYIDTLALSRKYFPDMKHHRLTDMAARYGICTDGAHRGLADCRMTQKVYECLFGNSIRQGIRLDGEL